MKVHVPVKRMIDSNVKVRVKTDGSGVEGMVRSARPSPLISLKISPEFDGAPLIIGSERR